MKQKIYIAALLAGMLALAGCGGGSDAVNDDENGDNQNMVNTFDASDCKAGTKVNDAGDGCIADTSIADQTKKEADYLAIFNALNGPIIGAATATQTSFTDSSVDDSGIQYYSLANAKDQDNYKSASISMQGDKFSELTGVTDGVLTLTAGVGGDHDKDHVMFSGVSTGQQETHEKKDVVKVSDDDTPAFVVSGSYRGVAGTYQCTGTCTSSIDNSGNLDLGGTAWTFKATDEDARITDQDVVTYGWWTDTPTGGSLTAGLFTDREDGTPVRAGYEGGGSATYKGEALGQYVMSADNFGEFTADATLTADFTETNTLEGMINGFKDADGGDLTGWEVKLHKTNIAVDGTFSGTQTGAENARQARWNIGDKKGAAGNWQGALYGPGGGDDAGKYPTYAAGEFSAQHGPTGRMIGAFGAELESN